MKFSIGVAILALSTIGTAQSPTFTRDDVARAFLCGKINGGLNMGIKEPLAMQMKMAYVLGGCQDFQRIADSKDAEPGVKK